jgi:hypothetical protein
VLAAVVLAAAVVAGQDALEDTGDSANTDDSGAESDLTAAQKEMAAYLTELGFARYATEEYIKALTEEGMEEVSDLADLVEAEIYKELKPPMDKAEAETIAADASKKELRDFLKWVDVNAAKGSTSNIKTYSHLLPKLIDTETTTLEEVSDLEAGDAEDLGISEEDVEFLSEKADDYTSYVFSGKFLQSISAWGAEDEEEEASPLTDVKVFEKYRDALVAEQVTTYKDIALLNFFAAIKPAHLKQMQADPRVRATMLHKEL